MAHVKFAWAGNRIDPQDMAKLHHIKETTRTPTTFIVHSKDLFDRKKNPNLSLSVSDILNNPKIPKEYRRG